MPQTWFLAPSLLRTREKLHERRHAACRPLISSVQLTTPSHAYSKPWHIGPLASRSSCMLHDTQPCSRNPPGGAQSALSTPSKTTPALWPAAAVAFFIRPQRMPEKAAPGRLRLAVLFSETVPNDFLPTRTQHVQYKTLCYCPSSSIARCFQPGAIIEEAVIQRAC